MIYKYNNINVLPSLYSNVLLISPSIEFALMILAAMWCSNDNFESISTPISFSWLVAVWCLGSPVNK